MIVYCPNCNYEGKAKSETPGYFLIELILWACFLLPGFIYSIWRLCSRQDVCSACGWKNIVRR